MDRRPADPFDVEAFLLQPLVARVAAAGPTVRPVWSLWDQECFWWLTGSYSTLAKILAGDPQVALVVNTCDLGSGTVRQVSARGHAEVVPFDAGRARRKLVRYLGPDETRWDERFGIDTLAEDPSAALVRLRPRRLVARDLSYDAGTSPPGAL